MATESLQVLQPLPTAPRPGGRRVRRARVAAEIVGEAICQITSVEICHVFFHQNLFFFFMLRGNFKLKLFEKFSFRKHLVEN